MVYTKLGLLHKIQDQSKKCYYLINHAKNVETKIKREGEGIQVMTPQVVPAVVIVINVYMMQVIMMLGLVICKNINLKIINNNIYFFVLLGFILKKTITIQLSHIISKNK